MSIDTLDRVRGAHPPHPRHRTPVVHRAALRLGLALVLWGRGYRASRADLARHVANAQARERRERSAERQRLLLPPR